MGKVKEMMMSHPPNTPICPLCQGEDSPEHNCYDLFLPGYEQPSEGVARRCECGSDSVNAPGHSNWCPKFVPEGGR